MNGYFTMNLIALALVQGAKTVEARHNTQGPTPAVATDQNLHLKLPRFKISWRVTAKPETGRSAGHLAPRESLFVKRSEAVQNNGGWLKSAAASSAGLTKNRW